MVSLFGNKIAYSINKNGHRHQKPLSAAGNQDVPLQCCTFPVLLYETEVGRSLKGSLKNLKRSDVVL